MQKIAPNWVTSDPGDTNIAFAASIRDHFFELILGRAGARSRSIRTVRRLHP
jgi:hypothetical protein